MLFRSVMAIHAQEDRSSAEQKALLVVEKLEGMRLSKAAAVVREGAGETLGFAESSAAERESRANPKPPENHGKLSREGGLADRLPASCNDVVGVKRRTQNHSDEFCTGSSLKQPRIRGVVLFPAPVVPPVRLDNSEEIGRAHV